MSNSLRPHGLQHARLPCPLLSSGVCWNSGPLNQWCCPTRGWDGWDGLGVIPMKPYQGFPGGSASKEPTCNVGDLGSIPGLERSPGEGHGNPLQYSCLENPHAQRSLEGYSPRGHKELDMTEWLSKELFMKNHLIRKIKYLAQCCPAKKEKAKIRTEVYLTLYPWTLHPLKVPKPQNR